ncbi:MAG: CDP-alcohol phosphatidyltransferase family protein [archaeon]|nr:CDP-alcohol phosphatidyltransferase family protein [archaeon]
MDQIGSSLGKVGVTPNFLTACGFLLALLAGFLFAYKPAQQYLAALSIIGSGVLDILDGAVARTTGKVSMLGSFNDSSLDRISEIAIFAGIIYAGYGLNPAIVLLTLGFSLLVSYVRAKGESLGMTMSGIGVGERAERLLVLIVFSLAGYVWIAVYIILILAAITFVQRYAFMMRMIKQKNKDTLR